MVLHPRTHAADGLLLAPLFTASPGSSHLPEPTPPWPVLGPVFTSSTVCLARAPGGIVPRPIAPAVLHTASELALPNPSKYSSSPPPNEPRPRVSLITKRRDVCRVPFLDHAQGLFVVGLPRSRTLYTLFRPGHHKTPAAGPCQPATHRKRFSVTP